MNIKYHLAVGIGLDVAFKTKGLMTLFSVLPDVPLLTNEYRLWAKKIKFDPSLLSEFEMNCYFYSHSLLACSIVFLLDYHCGIAYLLHIICDWFTHTGKFSSRPFYPFNNYAIKFGRNILK